MESALLELECDVVRAGVVCELSISLILENWLLLSLCWISAFKLFAFGFGRQLTTTMPLLTNHGQWSRNWRELLALPC